MNEAERGDVCGLHLNAREREQISIGLAQGLSGRAIGRQLNRPACTISREKLRHQVPADNEAEPLLYRGYWAQQQAVIAKRRCGRKRKLDEYRNFKRPFSLFLNVSDGAQAVKRARNL